MTIHNPPHTPLGDGFLPYLTDATDRPRAGHVDSNTITGIVREAEEQFVADLIREFNATEITAEVA